MKKYYKEIARALQRNGQKTLLPGIRAGVDSYLAENPDAAIDDVIAYVGTPECIANEYYANQDGRELTKEMKVGKKIWLMMGIFALSVVLILAAAAITFKFFDRLFEERFVEYTVDLVSVSDAAPTDIF